ncbi:MAG: restriction endonuclease subunit S [Huintestinicola sp.]
MSRLDELIREYCPDEVKFESLNSHCKIYDGTHNTPKYTDSGVKFVSVENINDLYSTSKFISEEDYKKYKIKPQINDILMTRIGSIGVCTVVDKNDPLAYYVSLALIRPDINVWNSKFLKYAIESLQGRKELRKRTLVNAVPKKINKDDIGKIILPVPPIEVQREIARILDEYTASVTALQQELEAELAARRKQYEYYRDKLLNFDVHGGGDR